MFTIAHRSKTQRQGERIGAHRWVLSKQARRCCWPHLRGLCPAKEHLRAWAEAMRRRHPRRFPVRRSAVNGTGTPQGAGTTETVLHVDAAKRLPDARMPSQEGHHAGGLEQCDSPQDQAEREHQPTVVMVSHQPLRAKATSQTLDRCVIPPGK